MVTWDHTVHCYHKSTMLAKVLTTNSEPHALRPRYLISSYMFAYRRAKHLRQLLQGHRKTHGLSTSHSRLHHFSSLGYQPPCFAVGSPCRPALGLRNSLFPPLFRNGHVSRRVCCALQPDEFAGQDLQSGQVVHKPCSFGTRHGFDSVSCTKL